MAEDEARVQRRRERGLWLLLAVALAVVVMLVTWWARSGGGLTVKLTGDVAVTQQAAVYTVTVPLEISEAATLTTIGGAQRLDAGAHTVRLEIPATSMRVGINPVTLTLQPEGDSGAVVRTINVQQFYQVTDVQAPPFGKGLPVLVTLKVMPGWTPSAPGAKVSALAEGFRLEVDPAPLMAKVDSLEGPTGPLVLALTLTDEAGATQQFQQVLQIPLPVTPVTLTGPATRWSRPEGSVTVTGRAHPEAEIIVGQQVVQAEAEGLFSVKVPLPSPGRHKIAVKVDAPEHLPAQFELTVERVSAADFKARGAARAAAVKGLVARGGLIEGDWAKLLKDPEGTRNQRTHLKGAVIAVRRGEAGGDDVILMSACEKAQCPVQVITREAVAVQAGDRVAVVGRLAGLAEFQTREGARQALRLIAEEVEP